MRNESKLTKYTLLGCTLLLIAYFSASYSRAEEFFINEEVILGVATCASITIVSEAIAPNPTKAHEQRARFWSELLKVIAGHERGKALVTSGIEEIKNGYTAGDITWEQLRDLDLACFDLQPEIERRLAGRENSE